MASETKPRSFPIQVYLKPYIPLQVLQLSGSCPSSAATTASIKCWCARPRGLRNRPCPGASTAPRYAHTPLRYWAERFQSRSQMIIFVRTTKMSHPFHSEAGNMRVTSWVMKTMKLNPTCKILLLGRLFILSVSHGSWYTFLNCGKSKLANNDAQSPKLNTHTKGSSLTLKGRRCCKLWS